MFKEQNMVVQEQTKIVFLPLKGFCSRPVSLYKDPVIVSCFKLVQLGRRHELD